MIVRIFLIALLVLSASATARAQFSYTTNSDGSSLTITGYSGPGGAVTIPSSINGFSVTSIGIGTAEGVFQYSGLTSIVIPNSITNIGDYAFANNNVQTITIPGSVIGMGNNVCFQCSLTNAVFADGATVIGANMFNDCPSLNSIIIGDSITNIGNDAFLDCSDLTNITVNASNPVYSSLGGVLFGSGLYESPSISLAAAICRNPHQWFYLF